MRLPDAGLAVLFMVLAQVGFSIMNVSARSSANDLPWQEVAAARFFMGAVVAFTWGRIRGAPLALAKGKTAWVRTLCGTGAAMGTFFTLASKSIPIGDAVTLMATSPLWVSLLAWPLLGEHVRRVTVVALGLSFAGLVAVAKPQFAIAPLPVAASLSTAVLSACAMIALRRIGPSESSEAVVLHFSLFGLVVLTILAIPVWQWPSGTGLALLVITGLSGGLAQLSMTRAYSLAPASTVSALGYLTVVFTRILAFPVFGERPDASQVLGSVAIIGAGCLLAFDAVRCAPAPAS
jgi:drug/metabolite transporter (DMT)-like permease